MTFEPAGALHPGWVVDASVGLKWLVQEPDQEAALALQGRDLLAPALLRIEVANALRSTVARGGLEAAKAVELFGLFQTAPVEIVPTDDALERHALELAIGLKHPVYDCVYLALALRTGRRVVTADARFLRALAGTVHEGRAVALEGAGG